MIGGPSPDPKLPDRGNVRSTFSAGLRFSPGTATPLGRTARVDSSQIGR